MPTPQAECEVLSLAAGLELSENSRPGFASKVNAQEPGLLCANLQSTLGIHVTLPENRGGSRIQTWNRYAYVGNNPLSNVDPLGLDDSTTTCDSSGHCTNVTNVDVTASAPSWFWLAFEGWPGTGSAQSFFCMLMGGCNFGKTSSGGGGSGGQTQPPAQPKPAPPNNGIKSKICSAIPSGRTLGVSAGVGGVGSPGGGGELVVNYNSGQVSAFAFGGVQVGWNGGISGSAYSGFVWGLNNSNTNYSGGFSGVNGGAGLGGFAASSSGGLTGGPSGLIPNPRGVTAAGVSFGGGVLGGFSGGVTATNYTSPAQLGKFWAFSPLDWALYGARQVCQ